MTRVYFHIPLSYTIMKIQKISIISQSFPVPFVANSNLLSSNPCQPLVCFLSRMSFIWNYTVYNLLCPSLNIIISCCCVYQYFIYCRVVVYYTDFPGGSDSKESACNAGDVSSTPGSGRFPGEGNGYPLQYPCLENSMNRGTQWATWGH